MKMWQKLLITIGVVGGLAAIPVWELLRWIDQKRP